VVQPKKKIGHENQKVLKSDAILDGVYFFGGKTEDGVL